MSLRRVITIYILMMSAHTRHIFIFSGRGLTTIREKKPAAREPFSSSCGTRKAAHEGIPEVIQTALKLERILPDQSLLLLDIFASRSGGRSKEHGMAVTVSVVSFYVSNFSRKAFKGSKENLRVIHTGASTDRHSKMLVIKEFLTAKWQGWYLREKLLRRMNDFRKTVNSLYISLFQHSPLLYQ